MRIMLKLVLDCPPDAAWRAVRDPAVFRAVSAPFAVFDSLEEGGFPERWASGEHPVQVRAFGLVPMGDQMIDIAYTQRGDARLVHDTGGGIDGPVATVSYWHHTMAVSPTADGRTLFRDRLLFDASPLTLLIGPALWLFWQWRGVQLKRLAKTW